MNRIIKRSTDPGKIILEARVNILERKIEYLSEALQSIVDYAETRDMKNLVRFAKSKLTRVNSQ